MQSVPIHQAKSQLSALISAVEQGEEVVLTRHGKRVVRLVREPDDLPPSIEARRAAIATELEALRAKVGPCDAEPLGAERALRQLRSESERRAAGWLAASVRRGGDRAGD